MTNFSFYIKSFLYLFILKAKFFLYHLIKTLIKNFKYYKNNK